MILDIQEFDHTTNFTLVQYVIANALLGCIAAGVSNAI